MMFYYHRVLVVFKSNRLLHVMELMLIVVSVFFILILKNIEKSFCLNRSFIF
jgi:hypothetical protein